MASTTTNAFKSAQNNSGEEQTDALSQMLIMNEDLPNKANYGVAMMPFGGKDTNASFNDISGQNISSDDQIVNITRLNNLDQTQISYMQNEPQNISADSKYEWLNHSAVKPSGKFHNKEVLLRKESEDSFMRMCNPHSFQQSTNPNSKL